jgi:hypothetical protein
VQNNERCSDNSAGNAVNNQSMMGSSEAERRVEGPVSWNSKCSTMTTINRRHDDNDDRRNPLCVRRDRPEICEAIASVGLVRSRGARNY